VGEGSAQIAAASRPPDNVAKGDLRALEGLPAGRCAAN